jgi:hypothetical protein
VFVPQNATACAGFEVGFARSRRAAKYPALSYLVLLTTRYEVTATHSATRECMYVFTYIYIYIIKVKVKQSRYMPGVAQRVPGC